MLKVEDVMDLTRSRLLSHIGCEVIKEPAKRGNKIDSVSSTSIEGELLVHCSTS